MSNRVLTASERRRSALPALVLVAMAVMFVLAAAAGAADPPIVSVGVGSGGQADACVTDDHSGADPSNTNSVAVNDRPCASGSGSGSGSSAGSSSGGGASGSRSSTRSGSTSNTRGSTGFVSAGQAIGLQITRVRTLTKSTKLTFRVGLLVTLRDARGRLVRGGIVSVGRVPGSQTTIKGTYSNFTQRSGQAQIVVPVTAKMFGKRLFVKISARTPRAQAVALRSVLLPRLR